MPLPESSDLDRLDYVSDGQPFVQITAALLDTYTLDYAFEAQPFISASFSSNVCSISIEDVIDSTDLVSSEAYRDLVEVLDPYDELFHDDGSIREAGDLSDSAEFIIILNIEEALVPIDDIKIPLIVGFDFTNSSVIKVLKVIDKSYSTSLLVSANIDFTATTDIAVIENYLLPVSNISNPFNPFKPTIVQNGSYLVSNIETNPPNGISGTSLYINVLNAGLTTISTCDLESYNFTLDYGGGSWSITSTNVMGNLGDSVSIFGFKGTITESGRIISNSVAGFTYSGTFGNSLLDKQFQYMALSSDVLASLVTSGSFTRADSTKWLSARTVASAVASIAGVSLSWLIPDVPVSDFRLENTMTAGSAMSSMAERAGGQLRWNGDSSYQVVYPDQAFGIWQVPDCSLLLPEGIKQSCFLNLNTGNTSNIGTRPSSVVQNILATPSLLDPTTKTLPTTNTSTGNGTNNPAEQGTAPQIQQVAKITKKLTDEDPPLIYDLPYDYDKVYVQILVSATGSTGGTNKVSTRNFITKNPQEFFEYDVSGFGQAFIFTTNIGGVLQPQVLINDGIFPEEGSNDTIDDGNFVLTVSCTRKSLSPSSIVTNNTTPAVKNQIADLAKKQEEESKAKLRDILTQTESIIKFAKNCSYSISSVFFGSIPVPGMIGKVTVPGVVLKLPDGSTKTIGDVVVEGIIESVSFSYPGNITVQLSTYTRFNYYEVRYIEYGP